MENIYKNKEEKISKEKIVNIFVIILVLLMGAVFYKFIKGFLGSTLEIFKDYSSYYFGGLFITIILALVSVIIGSIFGLIIYILSDSSISSLKYISRIYVELIRGTPLLAQLMIVFFGLASVINFKSMGISIAKFAFLSGVIAVSLNSAAYVCEIIRSGINSIDKGQFEASYSLGMDRATTMEEVILPQAIKNILPALCNEFITVTKETSIVSVIGVTDIMYNVNLIRGNSYKSIEPLIIATLLYFLITFTLSRLVKLMEVKLNDWNKKFKKILWE